VVRGDVQLPAVDTDFDHSRTPGRGMKRPQGVTDESDDAAGQSERVDYKVTCERVGEIEICLLSRCLHAVRVRALTVWAFVSLCQRLALNASQDHSRVRSTGARVEDYLPSCACLLHRPTRNVLRMLPSRRAYASRYLSRT
jgi:hypothetical protein